MSANKIINSGNTQLYNQVYCNFIPTNSLGFNTCTNCNFTDIKPFTSTQQSSENSCNTACSNNPVCVGYTYNTQTGNCDNFNVYPNVINYNASNNNSGYYVNGSYDYNSLSSQQQNNVKVKCADQFLNNLYIGNNNIEIANCISVTNSGSNTLLNVDPTCLNSKGINTNTVNQANYNLGNISTTTISDPTIDKYMSEYNSFTTADVQNININNKLSEYNKNPIIDNSNILYNKYRETVEDTAIPLKASLKDLNKALGIERFENEKINTINKLKIIPLLLIIFIIFIILFYVFKKK
jgi:hypothetical protein